MTDPVASESSRVLGFWTCTALVVGNTIGIGIFLLPASLAPYGLNALWAWLITMVGCMALALVFSGLARTFPQDDGLYSYTRRAFGPGVTFFVLWCYWFSTWVTNSTIAIGIVGYVSILVPDLQKVTWLPPYVALALVWLFVFINCLGIRTAAWLQMITTALKLLPQLGIILLGLWQLYAHPASYTAHVPSNPISFRDILATSTLALFAMLGIECAMIPAGKVRDPGRTIPRATLVGMLVTGLIYLCVSMIPLLLIPQAQLAASNSPFADLFGQYVGPQYGRWLALFIVVGGLGALNGWTLIVGEMTQSFARHGDFPAVLGKVNSRGAPAPAFLLTGLLASVMLVLNYNASLANVFTFLITVVTASNLPIYLCCSLAVLILRRRGQIRTIGRRQIVWFVAAWVGAVYCLWAFAGVGAAPFLWTLALAAAGIPFWWFSRLRQPATQHIGPGGIAP
jgi:APA family basic amino acid/polyamine antiporter